MVGSNEMTLSLFESRFKNRQYIGSGGFAKVYKAFDHAKNHYVALKVADVRPEWKQFTLLREVELVNKLSPHPNIARYDACYRFDMGVAGEIDFAILKFYEDGNLDQFMSTHKLSAEDTHIIVRGILRGVSFLHNNNYVHRDLKSQNILLQREDGVWTPKITDFGLSRSMGAESTTNNSAIGLSYSYAAPEQIQNRRIFKNVDLWAVGVVIYKMIAGELPFKTSPSKDGRDTQSQLELSRMIVNAQLPEKLNELQEPYQSIIKRCLVADPKLRCQTADELLYLLDGEHPSMGNYQEEEDSHFEALPSPTLFVPVEPEPELTVLGDQTELVGPLEQPLPIEAPVQVPQPSVQVQDLPRQEPPPASFGTNGGGVSFFPTTGYEEPKPDYTQIIEQPNRVGPVPEIPVSPVMSGEPEKKFKWWYVLLPLLLIAASAAAYFYFLPKAPSGYIEGFYEPIPVYEDIKKQNEQAEGDKDALVAIGKDIEKSIKRYPSDYWWLLELAKNKAYLGEGDEAFQILKKAALVAMDNNGSQALASAISSEANRTFKVVSSGNSNQWNKLLKALQQQDKAMLD